MLEQLKEEEELMLKLRPPQTKELLLNREEGVMEAFPLESR
jgi:hypothetical protein